MIDFEQAEKRPFGRLEWSNTLPSLRPSLNTFDENAHNFWGVDNDALMDLGIEDAYSGDPYPKENSELVFNASFMDPKGSPYFPENGALGTIPFVNEDLQGSSYYWAEGHQPKGEIPEPSTPYMEHSQNSECMVHGHHRMEEDEGEFEFTLQDDEDDVPHFKS